MDDNTPTTKADIRRIEESIQKLTKIVRSMAEGMERLHEADDQILTVLVNVDKRLTGKVENHESRIVRLESVAA